MYRFVGLWETVEKLVECDSLSDEVLVNHPEIETFSSVFFSREVINSSLIPLGRRQAVRRGKVSKIGKGETLESGERGAVEESMLNIEIDVDHEEFSIAKYESPKRSLIKQLSGNMKKKSRV